ncbi:MAG TPA: hypothetical protein ENJ68_05130 [Devosia sp.]|nr:hypothetical protein [Devosia sp.]
MAQSDPSVQEENSEMSAEARAVIGKARRSFGFSMSILILGFMAIVLALVYRATRDGESVADRYQLESVPVPGNAEVISLVPVRDVIALTYRVEGATMLRLIRVTDGEVIKEIPVGSETP